MAWRGGPQRWTPLLSRLLSPRLRPRVGTKIKREKGTTVITNGATLQSPEPTQGGGGRTVETDDSSSLWVFVIITGT